MTTKTPDELFAEGEALLPRFGDESPDVDERYDRAVAIIRAAAEAGHHEAMESMSDMDKAAGFEWAVRLAKLGETNALVMALTSGDWPVEKSRAVLDAARAGEPWAQLAVGEVYRLGMQRVDTGIYVATQENGFGWLPAAKDPKAEGLRWLQKAFDAGFVAASLTLAYAFELDDPEHALKVLTLALHNTAQLPPKDRRRVPRLCAKLLDRADAPMEERIAVQLRLAHDGDEDAIVWLADQARDGEGMDENLELARALYERAAVTGSVDGCRELAKMCERGIAGPVDEELARELYETAAELGADRYSRDRLVKKWGLTFYARGPGER